MKIKKPKATKKRYLKPAGKVALYGSLATLIAATGLKVYGDYILDKYNNDNQIDEAITECEKILGPENIQETVSKFDEEGMLSYSFSKNEALEDFKEARKIYEKYKNKPLLSKEVKEEREKALDTIINSNDKIIELFNEVTKKTLASQLHTSPDQIEIYYNKPYEQAKAITTIKIDNEDIMVGPELEELIETYKDGLLITYNIDLKNMPLSIKEDKVKKILENIKEYRSVLNDLNKPDTTYTIYRREPSSDNDYLVYYDSEYEETFQQANDIKPLPKVEFLNIKVNKKDKEKNQESIIKPNTKIEDEER